MFSLKTLYIRPRRLLPALACTLAFLLVLELALRKADWFYDYEGWESPALLKKMERAEELFEREGHIDVVVLSTSIGRPIDVTQWEDATSGSLVAYNFGYPDQRPEKQYFLFKNYIYPRYKPESVIYALSVIDCNASVRGMDPRNPRNGPFWTYRKIQALAADTFLEKAVSWLEERSYLIRSRKRARFRLQYGPAWMLQEEPTIGNGVLVPTVRRLPAGPLEKSWALHPLGLPYNCYHNYWIPDDGEIGQVLKLAKFCKKHGVNFAVVDMPTSPYGHTNFDHPEDYWKFQNALNYLRSKGVWVLPMAAELGLNNTHFEDQDHMNRWGGNRTTNYVYEHVIRKWFPDKAKAATLPAPVRLAFSDLVTSGTSGVRIERHDPATKDAQYASDLQALVTRPMDILLSGTVAKGSYAVELYAGDGTTTAPELSGEVRMELAAVAENGETVAAMPLNDWINSRIGVSYTQAYFTIPMSSSLVLRVLEIGDRPLILDSAFIRMRPASGGNKVIVD